MEEGPSHCPAYYLGTPAETIVSHQVGSYKAGGVHRRSIPSTLVNVIEAFGCGTNAWFFQVKKCALPMADVRGTHSHL